LHKQEKLENEEKAAKSERGHVESGRKPVAKVGGRGWLGPRGTKFLSGPSLLREARVMPRVGRNIFQRMIPLIQKLPDAHG
jgi:hypothetical protein